MLIQEDLSSFKQRGYVTLRGAFGKTEAEAMADFIWARLADLHGIDRDDLKTWAAEAPWVGLNKFKNEPVFEPIGSPALCQAIDQLLDAGAWRKPKNWGGFLVTFPSCNPQDWNIPRDGWHVDFHFTFEPETLFGLRVFTFLTNVGPRGGGTLVVSGSHRLVERYVAGMTPEQRHRGYSVLRDRFNVSDPWFVRLTQDEPRDPKRISFFMEQDYEIAGVPVRVEELCGSPGDAIIAHPWLLHTRSPNASDRPRFVRGKDIYRHTGHHSESSQIPATISAD